MKKTNTIIISNDDDDGNNSRPGRSNGSVLMAKGAVKVQAARKLAGKHDVMKHLNKSKYSVGAPSRRVAETFNVFLSLGDNYPLVQLSEGQKHFELKPDDKIPSSDEFFRSLARSVRGWKSNTKYTEDHGMKDIPRHAYPAFCPQGNLKNPPVEFETPLDDPNTTVRELLTKMDEIKKGDT